MEQKYICGVDEVGRGALAGPVCVVALAMPLQDTNPPIGIDDSKRLSPRKREILAKIIQKKYIYSVGFVMPATIDRINILQATMLAMQIAINRLPPIHVEKILVDGNKAPDVPHLTETIIKGDQKEHSIMMASILAKVFRDDYMRRMHYYYPAYGFDQHSGYPTVKHKIALRQEGVSPIHRLTFRY